MTNTFRGGRCRRIMDSAKKPIAVALLLCLGGCEKSQVESDTKSVVEEPNPMITLECSGEMRAMTAYDGQPKWDPPKKEVRAFQIDPLHGQASRFDYGSSKFVPICETPCVKTTAASFVVASRPEDADYARTNTIIIDRASGSVSHTHTLSWKKQPIFVKFDFTGECKPRPHGTIPKLKF